MGDNPAGSTWEAAPFPSAYGIDAYKCYVCNTPNASYSYNFSDVWFPANSSRLIVDDSISFITSSSTAAVAAAANASATGEQQQPFYIESWFHISHAPMKPTAMQLQDYADFQSPDRSRSIDIASPETGAVTSVDPVTLCVGTYDTTRSFKFLDCNANPPREKRKPSCRSRTQTTSPT